MGYLLIDHSQSLPSVQQQYGKKQEYDTVSCRHCQAVIRVVHRQPQGAYCLRCGGPVCDTPRCASGCTPFFAAIARNQARERFFERLRVNS